MSTFSGDDYDFAQGSIKGLRSWGIDSLGRLHGVTHAEVWLPGDNVSICKATRKVECPEAGSRKAKRKAKAARDERVSLGYYDPTAALTYHINAFCDATPGPSCGERTCSDGKHTVPTDHTFDPDCQCGFWAYDEQSFTPHGDVTGVIEGYGKTTIGTKGFRSERARIVALSRDNGKAEISLSRWLRLQQLYPTAEFYDGLEPMISAHGAVLKKWEPVGEDFWTRAAPQVEDGLFAKFASGGHLSSALYPSYFRSLYGA